MSSTMQAWAYHKYGNDINDFKIENVPKPTATGTDLLIKNYALSLNPTDQKQKQGFYGPKDDSVEPIIGGRDASGVVEAVGPDTKGFKVGDEVYYAGSTIRPGSYAQYTLVDYRIVGFKPKSLSHEQAASLPLTSITVWEGVYEKLNPKKGSRALVTAAAGGVGSVAIQLCKYWGSHVTATASRKETVDWVKGLGADEVIDHSKPLADQVKDQKFDYIMHCHDDSMFEQLTKVIKPRGDIVFILPFFKDNRAEIGACFGNSISLHFEMMFSRSTSKYEMEKQGELLNAVAKLVDDKTVKPTVNQVFEWNDFKKAFELLSSGKTIGKTVIKIPQ